MVACHPRQTWVNTLWIWSFLNPKISKATATAPSNCRKLPTMLSESSSMASRERVENSTRPETVRIVKDVRTWKHKKAPAWQKHPFRMRCKWTPMELFLTSKQFNGKPISPTRWRVGQLKQKWKHSRRDTVFGSRFHASQVSCTTNADCPGTAVNKSADRTAMLKRHAITRVELRSWLSCDRLTNWPNQHQKWRLDKKEVHRSISWGSQV